MPINIWRPRGMVLESTVSPRWALRQSCNLIPIPTGARALKTLCRGTTHRLTTQSLRALEELESQHLILHYDFEHCVAAKYPTASWSRSVTMTLTDATHNSATVVALPDLKPRFHIVTTFPFPRPRHDSGLYNAGPRRDPKRDHELDRQAGGHVLNRPRLSALAPHRHEQPSTALLV